MSLKTILTLISALTVISVAHADTLLIEGIEQSSQSVASRPARGTSMDRVEAAYGAPTARVPPVGDPPISRWEYPGFIVYFEYDLVIHAVERR
jgi:hypothetical protein